MQQEVVLAMLAKVFARLPAVRGCAGHSARSRTR